jgi:DNA excision repair protein ERCC-6
MNYEKRIFLRTTRDVGLVNKKFVATKCIIFDHEWKQTKDVKERERAWRIGQTQEVTIYRLIISGTIEEKVYHRQVYKQFLTDRVLRDPRQKRFFKAKDLSDLFTLGDEYAEGTETAAIFSSLGTGITQFHEPERVTTTGRSLDVVQAGGSVEEDEHIDGSKRTPRDAKSAPNAFTEREEEFIESERGPTTGDGQGDARILQDLFDGSGICSALDHDKIEDAHNPENRIAQKEAQKIAERAAKALKQSRASVSSNPVNAPTWTGRSGHAGAPGIPKFGGVQNSALGGGDSALKSSNILAKIRARNAEATSLAVQSPEVSRAKSLADRIVAFLHSRGGSASSASVASTFRDSEAAGDPELFKSILKQVAILRRGQGGRTWLLKPEFRSETR